MSYPPTPPNNPYGNQPPQQPQQPYGYPQQAPQGVPPQAGQPGYGYPQQPPQSPYAQQPAQGGYAAYPQQAGYGYPQAGMPVEMPGIVKTARVLLFVVGGLQVLAGIFMLIGAAAVSSSSTTSGGMAAGALVFAGILVFLFAGLAIFLGLKFKSGGQGIRVTTIVYASLMLLGSLFNFSNGAAGILPAIIGLAVGGTLLAATVQSQAAAWFNRPKY